MGEPMLYHGGRGLLVLLGVIFLWLGYPLVGIILILLAVAGGFGYSWSRRRSSLNFPAARLTENVTGSRP